MEEKAYLNVKGILDDIGVSKGHFVGDLGCGTGYFSFPSSDVVGTTGKVFSADVQKHVIENIERQARMNGAGNVYTIWTDLEIVGAAKQLTDGLLDYSFLVNILFQTKKHADVIKEAIRVTKSGGYMLVIDWIKESTPFGPQLETRIDPEQIKRIAQDLGLTLEREINPGKFHWGLLFTKE